MQGGRLFQLLYLLLEGENWTVRRLSERLEVSERTIRRDLDALSAAGVPVYTVQGRGGGVRLLPGFVLDRSLLSGQEQDAILYGLQTLHATGMDACGQLLHQLSGLFRREPARDWIDADFSPWNGGTGRALFDLLRCAILDRHPIRFAYYGASGTATDRTVEPVRLCFKGMSWYVQGWCRTRQDFRTFKLTRMADVRLCAGQTFAARPMPPLPERAAMDSSAMQAVIRFAPRAAYRVYDEFDRAQIAPQTDGALLVRAAWPADAWGVSYLLSYGSAAEVLEPQSLREWVGREAREIAGRYTAPARAAGGARQRSNGRADQKKEKKPVKP